MEKIKAHELCDEKLNVYIALGVGIGTAVGVAIDNMEPTMILGGVLGILFGLWNNRQEGFENDESA